MKTKYDQNHTTDNSEDNQARNTLQQQSLPMYNNQSYNLVKYGCNQSSIETNTEMKDGLALTVNNLCC